MNRPNFFRFDIIGVSINKEATEVNSLLIEIEGVLQVSLNNDFKLIYIEMDKIITVQEFNSVIQPKFKLENTVNIGFLTKFFP